MTTAIQTDKDSLQGLSLPTDLRSPVLASCRAANPARATEANAVDHVDGDDGRAPDSASRRSPIAECPAEVLCTIFDAVVRDAKEAYDRAASPDIFDVWHDEQDLIRPPTNSAPFTLSAVCRFWRVQALSLPSLWSFITVPLPGPSTPLYVDLMIERSRTYPLDFRICWPTFSNLADCASALEHFGSSAQRWRTVHMGIDGLYNQIYLNLFSNPTPLLQEVMFYRVRSFWDESRTTYPPLLPSCPRLQTLRTGIFAFFREPQYSQLSHLSHLDCNLNIGCKQVWELLGSCPLLEHLGVCFYRVDHAPIPDFILKLPSLRTLVSAGFDRLIAEWIDYIEMPALASVELRRPPEPSVHGTVQAIVERFCASVTTFRYQNFHGTLTEYDADALWALPRLRVLRLDSGFVPEFFFRLAQISHPIWPELTDMAISGNTGTTMSLEAADALWWFIRSRAASALFVGGRPSGQIRAGGHSLVGRRDVRIEDGDAASYRLLNELGKLEGSWSKWNIRIYL